MIAPLAATTRSTEEAQRRRTPVAPLPPGQRLVDGFPRFGTHLSRPAPAVPADPTIEVRGAMTDSFSVPLATLATLARREVDADFHCVTGWTAANLCWEGVSFETFFRRIIEPAVPSGAAVTTSCSGASTASGRW